MMMMISLFGHLGLRAPSSRVRDVFTSTWNMDYDDNKPVWLTWAVGALFRDVRCIHMNHVCFHIFTDIVVEAV
jgi:hypothetical protein